MGVVSLFWERQAQWLSRAKVALWIAFGVAFIASFILLESGNKLGFVLFLVSLWCFGAGLVEVLYSRDRVGESMARRGSSSLTELVSVLIGIWFVGLLFMSAYVIYLFSFRGG